MDSVFRQRPSAVPAPAELREEDVQEAARQAAEAAGCTLLAVEIKHGGARSRVEVTVDREGGVTIEECAQVSRLLAARLDPPGEEPTAAGYVLEVGSPGLTRPLKTPSDYRLFQGRLALLQLRAPVAGRTQLRGRLEPPAAAPAGDDGTLVAIADETLGQVVTVPLSAVAWGRLDFDVAPAAPAARHARSTAPARRRDAGGAA